MAKNDNKQNVDAWGDNSPDETGELSQSHSGQDISLGRRLDAASQLKKKKKKKEWDQPAPSSGPGCFNRVFGIFGILLTVGILLVFLGALKASVLVLPPEETSREVVVSIPAGASISQIGNILEESGVIKSGFIFAWTARVRAYMDEKPVVLKAGEMALDPSLPVWEVMDLIAKGTYKLYPFTIPEGRNMFEIAAMVEKGGFGSAQKFIELCRDPNFIKSLNLDADSLEGYLFPDTYSFPKGTSMKVIIKTMTDSFWRVWVKYDGLAQKLGLNRHEVITLASIVEKETGAALERPMIAAVFFNRLAKGMKLQTDPTVVYGVDDYDGVITKKHLRTRHPYNTYVINGLPPGPIANPGEAAITAVVKPDIVPYLYFVSRNDGSGTHDFSKTLADHNRKVRRYLRGGK